MNKLQHVITDEGFLLTLIPHEKPFIMVDKLFYFSDDKIVSGFTVPSNNLLVQENLFSAPGLIENMAQTVALHTGYQYYLKQLPAPTGYIGAIKKAEMLALPPVAKELITTVQILHDIMGVTLVEAKVESDGNLLATSLMKTALSN